MHRPRFQWAHLPTKIIHLDDDDDDDDDEDDDDDDDDDDDEDDDDDVFPTKNKSSQHPVAHSIYGSLRHTSTQAAFERAPSNVSVPP